jgi:hypothetical protein
LADLALDKCEVRRLAASHRISCAIKTAVTERREAATAGGHKYAAGHSKTLIAYCKLDSLQLDTGQDINAPHEELQLVAADCTLVLDC